jgi:hypothetical protein
LFGDRVGGLTASLIVLALIGGLLVAQPGASGFQPFVLFGLASAALSAGRDLIGRRVDAGVPALAVAVGLSVVCVVVIGCLMLVFERWVMPSLPQLLLISGASAFMTLAQLLLFLSFRVAETRAVGAVLLHWHAVGAAYRRGGVRHAAERRGRHRHLPHRAQRRAGAAARSTPRAIAVAAMSAADRAHQNVRLARRGAMR